MSLLSDGQEPGASPAASQLLTTEINQTGIIEEPKVAARTKAGLTDVSGQSFFS